MVDALSGRERRSFSAPRRIEATCLSRDGRFLLFAQALVNGTETPLIDGGVRSESPKYFGVTLVDVNTGSELWTYSLGGRSGSMGFSPTGELVALVQHSDGGNIVHLVNASTGQASAKIELLENIDWDWSDSRMDISTNGQLALALSNSTVLVWDLRDFGAWK